MPEQVAAVKNVSVFICTYVRNKCRMCSYCKHALTFFIYLFFRYLKILAEINKPCNFWQTYISIVRLSIPYAIKYSSK